MLLQLKLLHTLEHGRDPLYSKFRSFPTTKALYVTILRMMLRSTLHEGSRPPKFEDNSHKILTQAKKRGIYDTTARKQVEFPFWSNLILSSWTILDFVCSILKHTFTLLEYHLQGMSYTPSCKGLGVDLG